MGPRFSRGRQPVVFVDFAATMILPALTPRRTAPVLQRSPDAAGEPEAIDRGRRSQRLEAMQFDATPLEAALLQDVARRGIGEPRHSNQVPVVASPVQE